MSDKTRYVIGEVGFGPPFGADAARVQLLEAHVKLLREVLQDCAALSDDVANRKHEALLATDL